MNDRSVFAVGESLMDVIFKGNQPVSANPGGSVLNSVISLGRLRIPVHLISELGNDDTGKHIIEFLSENQVGTNYIFQFDEGATALAMAYLDADEEAHYTFYKNYPARRLEGEFPPFTSKDILLFGSFFSITKEVRKPLLSLLESAQRAGAMIIYDPNFREPHTHTLQDIQKYIDENIQFADIIRGSGMDFTHIFDASSAEESYAAVTKNGQKNLIYTSGSGPVRFLSGKHDLSVEVPRISKVSSIGAGDNFNAGVIHSLIKMEIDRSDLDNLHDYQWKTMLEEGAFFGSAVAGSIDNYISVELAGKLRKPRSNDQ